MKEEPRTGVLKHHHLSTSDRERVLDRVAGRLAAEGAVLFAYVFGSFIEDQAFGDVDVAIFLDSECCPDAGLLSLRLDLEGRLEEAVGLPVDAVLLNDAPLGLRMAAVRGRVVHSRDESRRLTFVEATCMQAMDMAHLMRESLRDLLCFGALDRAQGR